MSDEAKVGIVVVIGLTLIILSAIWSFVIRDKWYIDAGYTRDTLPDRTYHTWVKK